MTISVEMQAELKHATTTATDTSTEGRDTINDRSMATSLGHVAAVLFRQLRKGCDNENCTNPLCFTGRCNTSQRPVRQPTARSARFITIATLADPDLDTKLCQYIDSNAVKESQQHQREEADEEYDHNALAQLLANTKAIQDAITPTRTQPKASTVSETNVLTRRILDNLEPLMNPPLLPNGTSNPAFMPNVEAAKLLWSSFESLYMHIHEHHIANKLLDIQQIETTIAQSLQSILGIAAGKIITTMSTREALDKVITKLHSHASTPAAQQGIVVLVRQLMLSALLTDAIKTTCFLTLKHVFTVFWDESPLLKHGTAANTALSLMAILLDEPGTAAVQSQLGDLFTHFDDVNIADTWMACPPNSESIWHIASGPFISTSARMRYFLTINHLKMRRAHTNRIVADKMLQEMSHPVRNPVMIERIGVYLQNYLLLRVRRRHLLQDSFNQLWSRQKSELVKPLRIRLLEMDNTAIGHDVGGVQIEYFNEVMKVIMNEESGFFTTNETGLAYFRPGSLHPLYMFEQIGILLALALYNGIPIPVNLPSTLYGAIMFPGHDASLDNLSDRWPSEVSSMKTILAENVFGWNVTYDFNLSVNGVHLTVSSSQLASLQQSIVDSGRGQTTTLKQITSSQCDGNNNISTQDHMNSSICEMKVTHCRYVDGTVTDHLAWPGWNIQVEDQPEEVVNETNKQAFVADYIKWLTYLSVKPQMDAFLRGFRTIIDDRALAMLHNPDKLRYMVEGDRIVDLKLLQQATEYEGWTTETSYVLDNFWKVLQSWSETRLKSLLRFVTASERISLASVFKWKISYDEDAASDSLPRSSTCFSQLYLPLYPDYETLDEKLGKAVSFGEYGFGSG